MKTLSKTYAEMSDEDFLVALREATLSLDPPNRAILFEAYKRLFALTSTAWLESEAALTPANCPHLHTAPLSGDTICDVSHEHCACGADYSKCCVLQH